MLELHQNNVSYCAKWRDSSEMRTLQWWRVNRILAALTLVFAMGVSTIFTSQSAAAEPMSRSAWQKISTPQLEAAMGSYGTTHSIVEYEGKVYAGGLADREDDDHYSATVYSQSSDGSWQLVSPDLGAGEDSRVTHMTVFQNKLYVAVAAWDQEALQLWTYESNTNTWSKDDTFTLNDERTTDYVTQVLGMEVVGGDTLCATTIDLQQTSRLAVMCTNGTHDWVQLPNTGLEEAEFTSNFFTNILTAPGFHGLGIIVNFTSSGEESSAVALYNDVTDLEGTWYIPNAPDFGPDRVISAAKLYVDIATSMGGVFAAVTDAAGATNVEIWEVLSIGFAGSAFDEPLRASFFISMYDVGTEQPGMIVSGTNSSGMAVLKSPDSFAYVWQDIGPTAEQIGPDGENPAEYVTALNIQDDGDIFLGLQGSNSANGNSTIWYYDDVDIDEGGGGSGDGDDEHVGGNTNTDTTPRVVGQTDGTTSTSGLIVEDSNADQTKTNINTTIDTSKSSEGNAEGTFPGAVLWLLILPAIVLVWGLIVAWRRRKV